jgi:hypothetical protein
MRGCWWERRRKAVEAVWPGLALGQTVSSGDGGAAAMGVSVENHGIRTQEISTRRVRQPPRTTLLSFLLTRIFYAIYIRLSKPSAA